MKLKGLSYFEQHVVFLDGRLVGHIKAQYDGNMAITGYRYFPKGTTNGGDTFATLLACKLSLETVRP